MFDIEVVKNHLSHSYFDHQVDDDDTPAPSTRLITGNPALDGAVVGVGVGIIG